MAAIEAGRDFEFVLRELLCELEKKGLNFSLKEEQKTAVKQLFEGRDVVAVLPTGFGKSLIFQLLVLLARRAKNQAACVLVICPLTSIINDQIQEVEAMGLCACNLSEKLSDLTDIEQGKFAIVYSSAEIAIDKRFLESLKKDSPFSRFIAACVIDESHTIETWTGLRKTKGKNSQNSVVFRGAYGELALLRSFFHKGTPFAALTGTADAATCSVIVSKLSLKKPLTIQVSPNRENLRFAVINEKKDVIFSKLDWLVYHIREKGETADKTVIFCNTMNDIASVVNYLMMKLGKDAYSPKESRRQPDCLLGIFHSSCWPQSKERVVRSFKGDGKVRVVVASTALSMGVNFPDIRYVVNWGPARSLLDQHQEAGRAGRDGKPSHVLIIYHGQQLSHCEMEIKEFVKTKDCLRVAAYKPLDAGIQPQKPAHSCCSFCASSCDCNQCEATCPLFEQTTQGEQGATRELLLTRPVWNEDKVDLRDSLIEVKDSFVKCHSMFDSTSCHGFSHQLVHDVVLNCHQLFTVNDVLEKCPVFSVAHALKILEIIQELFLDIPNFDEFMDIIRLEESSSSQKLSDVLRNATVFDDSTESEDDAGEDSIAVL